MKSFIGILFFNGKSKGKDVGRRAYIFLLLALSSTTFAQDSCRDWYQRQLRSQVNAPVTRSIARFLYGAHSPLGKFLGMTHAVGSIYGSVAISGHHSLGPVAGLGTYLAFMATPFAVGLAIDGVRTPIRKSRLRRMIRLIDQAGTYTASPDLRQSRSFRKLRRLTRKFNRVLRKLGRQTRLSMFQVAKWIVDSNLDRSLCVGVIVDAQGVARQVRLIRFNQLKEHFRRQLRDTPEVPGEALLEVRK